MSRVITINHRAVLRSRLAGVVRNIDSALYDIGAVDDQTLRDHDLLDQVRSLTTMKARLIDVVGDRPWDENSNRAAWATAPVIGSLGPTSGDLRHLSISSPERFRTGHLGGIRLALAVTLSLSCQLVETYETGKGL